MLHFLLSSLGYKIQYICTFFALDADTSKILMFLPFNIPGFLLLMYYTSKIPSRIWVRMFIGFLTSNVIFGVLLGETTLFETFPFLMDCFLIPYVFVVFYLHSTSLLALIIKFHKFYLIFFSITCYFYCSTFICSIYFNFHFV